MKACDICECEVETTTTAIEPVEGIELEQCALCLHNSKHGDYTTGNDAFDRPILARQEELRNHGAVHR